MNIFKPSANGWKSPKGPALFGPTRSCRIAAILRSPQVIYAATPRETANTITTRIALYRSIESISVLLYQIIFYLRDCECCLDQALHVQE